MLSKAKYLNIAPKSKTYVFTLCEMREVYRQFQIFLIVPLILQMKPNPFNNKMIKSSTKSF